MGAEHCIGRRSVASVPWVAVRGGLADVAPNRESELTAGSAQWLSPVHCLHDRLALPFARDKASGVDPSLVLRAFQRRAERPSRSRLQTSCPCGSNRPQRFADNYGCSRRLRGVQSIVQLRRQGRRHATTKACRGGRGCTGFVGAVGYASGRQVDGYELHNLSLCAHRARSDYGVITSVNEKGNIRTKEYSPDKASKEFEKTNTGQGCTIEIIE